MNDRLIHHLCYIVDDIPKAVDQWVETTGAGPFFHLGEHVEFEETLLEGEPCVFDHASRHKAASPARREASPSNREADNRAPKR